MSIEKRIARLEGLCDSDTIKNFESFMLECTKVTDALESGVRLDTLKLKRFHPAMKAGLAQALPDMEQAMSEALPLEVTAQLILIYRDPDARSLLTPTLTELVEQVLGLERAGKLAVGAD
jgi:hypothetical protein